MTVGVGQDRIPDCCSRVCVLIFDVVPGLVAQGESVRLTRGRSLVRSQSGPLKCGTGDTAPLMAIRIIRR